MLASKGEPLGPNSNPLTILELKSGDMRSRQGQFLAWEANRSQTTFLFSEVDSCISSRHLARVHLHQQITPFNKDPRPPWFSRPRLHPKQVVTVRHKGVGLRHMNSGHAAQPEQCP